MEHLSEVALRARQLGLSYGQYIAYRDTDYLDTYKKYCGYINHVREKVGHLYYSDFGGTLEVDKEKVKIKV